MFVGDRRKLTGELTKTTLSNEETQKTLRFIGRSIFSEPSKIILFIIANASWDDFFFITQFYRAPSWNQLKKIKMLSSTKKSSSSIERKLHLASTCTLWSIYFEQVQSYAIRNKKKESQGKNKTFDYNVDVTAE